MAYKVIPTDVKVGDVMPTTKSGEANLLKHFWYEKGDFTRYTSYDDISDKLKDEYPMLFEGVKRIRQGEDMVEYMLDKIIEESEDDLDEDY